MGDDKYDEFKDFLAQSTKYLETRIVNMEHKVTAVNKQIELLKTEASVMSKDNIKTTMYIDQLSKSFSEMTIQMQSIVTKLDKFINTIVEMEHSIKHDNSFNNRGRDLLFELIKWLLILVVSTVLVKYGA